MQAAAGMATGSESACRDDAARVAGEHRITPSSSWDLFFLNESRSWDCSPRSFIFGPGARRDGFGVGGGICCHFVGSFDSFPFGFAGELNRFESGRPGRYGGLFAIS